MTYYLILFQVDPIPSGAPGPIRIKINRANYEVIMQEARATIDCAKGKFIVNEKLAFVVEEENTLYCVTKVEKQKT